MRVFIPSLPTRFDIATNSRIPSIDLNPAAAFGELVHMTNEGDTIEEAMDKIHSAVSTMDEDDYILAVGDVALIAAALVYANDRFSSAKLLQWSRKSHKYNIQEVKF